MSREPNATSSPSDEDADARAVDLDHVTVENDDAPDECAVFPHDASENELLTCWIAAQEQSFVDLESMR